jgi:NHLM bacteriocin system ABC transporter ATP-binding protein
MADVVLRKREKQTGSPFAADETVRTALSDILHYYHISGVEIPENIQNRSEEIEYFMRPYGIMHRPVKLRKGWSGDAAGVFLGTRTDNGAAVALLPEGRKRYCFREGKKKTPVTSETEELIAEDAVCFYKPFPLRKMNFADFLKFIAGNLETVDLIRIAVVSLLLTLIGCLNPEITHLLLTTVAADKNTSLLISAAVLFISVSVTQIVISAVKSLVFESIQTKEDIAIQAAGVMRVLSLPASFFRKYTAGELSGRLQNISSLSNYVINGVLSLGITSLFSLVYIAQIFRFAKSLAVTAILVIFLTAAYSVAYMLLQMKYSKLTLETSVKESGIRYSLFSGVQKIRQTGSEKRAFVKWADAYRKLAKLTYDPPVILQIGPVVGSAITMFGMVVIYAESVRSHVSVADYYAFNVAYGMVSGAFFSLVGIASTVGQIKPIYEIVKPLFQTEPETAEDREILECITGEIVLSNVSFRYEPQSPPVIDGLSLKINPGDYVAIVGTTGCGKSTLVRLLLGFEKPQKGAIYYDGRDLNGIDLRSLRRNIGVVMQDGKLFQGTIFSNIAITAPWIKADQAWEAADMAGIGDDIRKMPMGMNTLISEGEGGISGGQKQRLMIARAIAPRPKILIFDEATSALDNVTQKIVSDSLNRLKCTRIVVAHRLSTIRECGRILVLDQGRIVGDGTYDELIRTNPFFANLVRKQRL